jgi:hypothetical protein
MRFLADENFPGAAVDALVAAGHDVVWVRVAAPGSSDEAIVTWAAREERIILTFDKDFGEQAGQTDSLVRSGVVLFRVPMTAAFAGATLAARIAERTDWAGHFSVVEPGRVRMRRLAGK